jgi:hypothetical protein
MSLQYRCFCIAGDVDAAAGVATVTTATGGESTDPATTMEEFPFPVPAMAWSRRMAWNKRWQKIENVFVFLVKAGSGPSS